MEQNHSHMTQFLCIHILHNGISGFTSSFSLIELKDFMICVTGHFKTKRKSILVNFDTDANGAIAFHTCTNEISLPFKTFKETDFELFRTYMDSVIKDVNRLTYNTV